MEKKSVRVALGDRHEKELQWLMEIWGFDRNATVARILERVVAAEKQGTLK
jgi:hypothetical protein